MYTIAQNAQKTFSTSQEQRVCVQLKCIKKVSEQSEKTIAAAKKIEKKPAKKVPKKTVPRHEQKKIPITPPQKVVQKKPVTKIQKKKKIVKANPKKQTVQKEVVKVVEEEKYPSMSSKIEKKCNISKRESREDIYLKNNLDKIAVLIHDNLYYPRRARKRGIEGIVVVRFHLNKEGDVTTAEIISAKQSILERAALRTINELSGEFPKPSEELTLTVPIHYKLD